MIGLCKSAGTYLDNCSSSAPCSTSQNLTCIGNNGTGQCLCNTSVSYWDGFTCVTKLTIGGQCSADSQCLASKNLTCSTYNQSYGTCDCNKHYYWNETCMLKLWYNISCGSQYECDDHRGLQCQGGGSPAMQGKCDCYNNSYIWDSLYRTRNRTCVRKLAYNMGPCYGSAECEEFNYLSCDNNTQLCVCNTTDYWSGTSCQPKRNYLEPCNFTYHCKDYAPVNLTCKNTTSGSFQCVCNGSEFWNNCSQECTVSKAVRIQS